MSKDEKVYNEHFSWCSFEVAKQKNANLNVEEEILSFNDLTYKTLSDTSSKHRYVSSYKHEAYMFQLKHNRCSMCQAVSLYKDYIKVRGDDGKYICNDCTHKNLDFFLKMVQMGYYQYGLMMMEKSSTSYLLNCKIYVWEKNY